VSPRAFDSDDVHRLTERAILQFTENVECPDCGLVFESDFYDDSGAMSVEDIVDPPVGLHTCPDCRRRWDSELTGWNFYSEAG